MEHISPRYRFMAAYEQRMEPPDRRWQYLLFAAEPYETIAFKVRLGELCVRVLLECHHLGIGMWSFSSGVVFSYAVRPDALRLGVKQ